MPGDLMSTIEQALTEAAVPERAEGERAYLKSDLVHLGVTVPAIRAAVRNARREGGRLDHDALVDAARRLWSEPVHERRMATVELLDASSDLLGRADAPLLEQLLREARTWAILDGLAASVVGSLAPRDAEAWGPVLDRWATDDDFWLRRAALLALLVPLRQGGGDFERFGRYADGMLADKEFFIRKAIGWVLRDTGRKRPDLVTAWLLPRAGRASGVTLREALKPLSPEQQEAVRQAASAGRSR